MLKLERKCFLLTTLSLLTTNPALADRAFLQKLEQRHQTTPLPQQRQQQQTFSTTLPNSMGQVTNVNELKDVSPNEWAYEALRSLVERYGCIVGYPERTYRGNRTLTRWEFAAGVNACLNSIERLIQDGVSVAREDIDKLHSLAQAFEEDTGGRRVAHREMSVTEIATLTTRIDNLEQRTAFLENHQFATTTKLSGDVILVYSGIWGNEQALAPKGTPLEDDQITVNYRYRAHWDTSFNGEDLLRIRFQTGNFDFARGGSNLTDFNFSAPGNTFLQVNKVSYNFPVTDNLTAWIAGAKLTLDDISDPLAPFTNSFTSGAVSFFGAIAPIYLFSDNIGPGVGALYEFTEQLNLSILYSTLNGNNPTPGNGIFNGQYVLSTQLTYAPSGGTGVGFAYSRHYMPSNVFDSWSLLGFTGVSNTDNPFNSNATSADNFALLGTWRVAPWLGIEGWGMYTRAYTQGGLRDGDTADIWNWKFSIAFPDLLQEGNVGVITVGQPPYSASITNRNYVADATDATEDTPWLVEVFYLIQLSDNVSITPAVYVGINPENDRAPLWVGALRTSFKF